MAREEGEEAFLNPQIAEFSGALACSSPCSCAAQFLCEQHWASSHSQELVLLLDDGQEVHRGIAPSSGCADTNLRLSLPFVGLHGATALKKVLPDLSKGCFSQVTSDPRFLWMEISLRALP